MPITLFVLIYIRGIVLLFNGYLSLNNDRDLWEIRRHIYCVYPAIIVFDKYYVTNGEYPASIDKVKKNNPSYYFRFMYYHGLFSPLRYTSWGDQYTVWIKPGGHDISYASESKTWRIHDFYYNPHLYINLYE